MSAGASKASLGKAGPLGAQVALGAGAALLEWPEERKEAEGGVQAQSQ